MTGFDTHRLPPPYRAQDPNPRSNVVTIARGQAAGSTLITEGSQTPFRSQRLANSSQQAQLQTRLGEDGWWGAPPHPGHPSWQSGNRGLPTQPSLPQQQPTRILNTRGISVETSPLLRPRQRTQAVHVRPIFWLVFICSIAVFLVVNGILLHQLNTTRADIKRLAPALDLLRRETTDELARQEALRRSWREEAAKHDAECLARADKRLREEERRDEEERAAMHLHWDSPRPAQHCWSYGAREYTARLWNIAQGYNWTHACIKTPITINDNIHAQPDWCDIPNALSGVIGHWIVTSKQDSCEPKWGKFFNKECIQPGRRRVESRLWHIGKGEDSYRLCTTAPAIIRDVRYDHPSYCFERQNDKAMVAIWEVDDPQC